MTPERLQEIRVLVFNARNGPYKVGRGNELSVTDADGETLGGTCDEHTWQFIEQSEPIALELLDEVDRLRNALRLVCAERDTLEARVNEFKAQLGYPPL